ncbi:MAG TPA: hypothetical protein VHO24_20840 [Opitutaceae bacterium]|nr:hypothetical protein [Opitutaceae bacterium]
MIASLRFSSRTPRLFGVLVSLAGAAGLLPPASAATSVAGVPVGYLKIEIAGAATTPFGVPLADLSAPPAGIRAGRIESFTANTISSSGAGWSTNLADPGAPWLVRIASGPSAGKLLDIAANTATTLTISGANLTALGLTAGTDTFELVPMDTLWSLLGSDTVQGGVSAATADNVQVRSGTSWLAYYFDTGLGYWRRTIGPATNSNHVRIRPESGVQIVRRGAGGLTLTFAGRVPAHSFRAPVNNASSTVIHAGFPTDVTLGALAMETLLPGWRSHAVAASADQLALYQGNAWVGYFHNGSFWQPVSGAAVDSGGLAIPAGALFTLQRPGVTPGTTDLVRLVPYSL